MNRDKMDSTDRLNLQRMIKESDVEDQTNLIREKRHSIKIREQVKNLISIKKNNTKLAESDMDAFNDLCILECNFLFNNYMDIFNKIKKDEINLEILDKFLDILRDIEDGNVDQHEGSFSVGKYLKELYIDSALKKSEKLEKENKIQEERKGEERKISWKEYKLNEYPRGSSVL